MRMILNILIPFSLLLTSNQSLSHISHSKIDRKELASEKSSLLGEIWKRGSYFVGVVSNPMSLANCAYNIHSAYTHKDMHLRTVIFLYNFYDATVHSLNFLSYTFLNSENEFSLEEYLNSKVLFLMNGISFFMHPLHILFVEKESLAHLLNGVEVFESLVELNDLHVHWNRWTETINATKP